MEWSGSGMMKKVLVANRGEIAIRVFRACAEFGHQKKQWVSTLQKDEYSVHRFLKRMKRILSEKGKRPIEAYLDIEDIIRHREKGRCRSDSSRLRIFIREFSVAQRCEEEGLIFIGPSTHHLDIFGDKIKAKNSCNRGWYPIHSRFRRTRQHY